MIRPMASDAVLVRRLPGMDLGRTTLAGAFDALHAAGVPLEIRWARRATG